MKEYLIEILKAENDPSETKFVGLNGQNYRITVGKPVWVPSDLYDLVLVHGNLKDRVRKFEERLV